jgi:FAD binding domain
VLRPAGLPEGWRSSYVSSDPRHRPQSSRVQHRCPGRARQYRASRVFLAGDSARIINPPTGGLGGNTEVPPGRPQPGLEAVAAVLQGQARPTLLDTYHTMRTAPDRTAHYMQQRPLPGSAPAWVKTSRCPSHRLWSGDDGIPRYRSSAVLGA